MISIQVAEKKNKNSKLKQLCLTGLFVFSFIQMNSAVAQTQAIIDPLNLAGTYHCHGYDSHEGAYKGATVTLTLDAKDSDFKHNHGAYHFLLVEPDGTRYTGEAAASGNDLAVYFQNTSKTMKTDRGVGIASVTHDKNSQGKATTVFHKFYYEPDYEGGGNGSETCVKVD
jgi:hypothetical protein